MHRDGPPSYHSVLMWLYCILGAQRRQKVPQPILIIILKTPASGLHRTDVEEQKHKKVL